MKAMCLHLYLKACPRSHEARLRNNPRSDEARLRD